jgi:alpha-D-ribose 1-methylphosphonate 5-triphosphate diphosphatase
VPASLLIAAFQLQDVPAVGGLPGAIRLVSRNVAAATGLADRGEIAVGKKADLVHVRVRDGQPIVRHVWRAGDRVA